MELRKYQIEARDAAWSTLHDYEGPTVVTMPTGSGKSLIIAAIVELAATKHGGRVLCLCHRKELIRQNAEKIELITGQPCGIYSAGLKRRDTEHDVIVASIQSVYKRAEEFGKRHLIIVDEAHLISDNDASMYQRFFAVLNAKLIGLTATPFRCGTGPIAGKDRMFHSICYEKNVGEMIDAGWLCRLTNKPTMVVDTSDVKIRGGEFVPSSLELRFASDDIVDTACRQIVELTADRSSVLIFCAGVEHVYRVLDKLEQITDRPAGAVTGETPAIERDAILRRFDAGELRYLVNCELLCIGYDSPRISAVVSLRATLSPGLWAQQVGRGLRQFPGKNDCLILDFAGNTARHGSLDSPSFGRTAEREWSRETAAAERNGRGWLCPQCGDDVPSEMDQCACGCRREKQVREPTHDEFADHHNAIIGEEPRPLEVLEVSYRKHNKPDKPTSLKATYLARPIDQAGNMMQTMIHEWICFEHAGFARKKAEQWWQDRSEEPVPDTVDDALRLIKRHCLVAPSIIDVKRDGHFHRIDRAKFTDDKPTALDWATLPFADDFDEAPF